MAADDRGLQAKGAQSGEIADWNAHCVHENDAFDYEEGDNPHIFHRPVRGDRGPVIAAYTVARYRTGEMSREWMWIEELDKVRARLEGAARAVAGMAGRNVQKTVAKRHAKVLPMSSDLDDLLRRPDEPNREEGSSASVTPLAASKRRTTAASGT